MDELVPEANVFDDDGAPATVYLTRSSASVTEDGWLVTSLDVGDWRPLHVGDRLVALDRDSSDEFLVEVIEVIENVHEVYYRLVHLADMDPVAEPGLDSTRSWLTPVDETAGPPPEQPGSLPATAIDADEAWRDSPTAPCGCEWDGWHCPHCGLVTSHSGDAWSPAHTLKCHEGAAARADSTSDPDEGPVELDDDF